MLAVLRSGNPPGSVNVWLPNSDKTIHLHFTCVLISRARVHELPKRTLSLCDVGVAYWSAP
jgi:hypothetical protein